MIGMASESCVTFRLDKWRRLSLFWGGIASLGMDVGLGYELVTQNLNAFNRIVFFFGILIVIALGVFAIFFSRRASLRFTPQGLVFSQPLVLTECAWDQLKGFRIKKNALYIVFATGKLTAQYLPPRALANPQFEIPLHLFIRGWKSKADWERTPVLKALKTYLPIWIKLPS